MSTDRIRKSLDCAGYTHAPATLEALRECFMDYVASGYFCDLDYVDAKEQVESGEITEDMMIKALLNRA